MTLNLKSMYKNFKFLQSNCKRANLLRVKDHIYGSQRSKTFYIGKGRCIVLAKDERQKADNQNNKKMYCKIP